MQPTEEEKFNSTSVLKQLWVWGEGASCRSWCSLPASNRFDPVNPALRAGGGKRQGFQLRREGGVLHSCERGLRRRCAGVLPCGQRPRGLGSAIGLGAQESQRPPSPRRPPSTTLTTRGTSARRSTGIQKRLVFSHSFNNNYSNISSWMMNELFHVTWF